MRVEMTLRVVDRSTRHGEQISSFDFEMPEQIERRSLGDIRRMLHNQVDQAVDALAAMVLRRDD